MKTKDINSLIFEGDYVADHMDDNRLRRIISFTNIDSDTATVNMSDGGCMGLNEIRFNDIKLPSESES